MLRQGRWLQTKRVNADELQELPVEFEVVEPEWANTNTRCARSR